MIYEILRLDKPVRTVKKLGRGRPRKDQKPQNELFAIDDTADGTDNQNRDNQNRDSEQG